MTPLLVLALLSIGCLLALTYEYWGTVVLLTIFSIAIIFFAKINVVFYDVNLAAPSADFLFTAIPIYLVLGAVTAVIKWTLLMSDFGAWLKRQRADFDLYVKGTNAQEYMKREGIGRRDVFIERILRTSNLSAFSPTASSMTVSTTCQECKSIEHFIALLVPAPADHIDKFSVWILLWPWVLVSTFMREFVIRFVDYFVSIFSGAFKSIGRFFLRDSVKDFDI